MRSPTALNKHYKIGHINAGAKKTVNLRVNVKKNLKEGYYPVKLYISKRSRGEDGMSGEFQKTVMVWAETKEASSTSESDESSTEPIGFALGENQSTPQANYNEVMNFNMEPQEHRLQDRLRRAGGNGAFRGYHQVPL